ncbi:MAG: biopolymer transporter ExbD [Myxococcota bacterium]|nr:biopolymer transporter ExbD [Myxococcota bacterium]
MIVPHEEEPGIFGINVTPLVDITLVLLIILMVTAPILMADSLAMDLPAAVRTEKVQMVFSVQIPATGTMLVNGMAAGDDELVALARRAVVETPDLRAVISADGAVPHRRVLHILDLLKSAGVERLAFGAEPLEEAGP